MKIQAINQSNYKQQNFGMLHIKGKPVSSESVAELCADIGHTGVIKPIADAFDGVVRIDRGNPDLTVSAHPSRWEPNAITLTLGDKLNDCPFALTPERIVTVEPIEEFGQRLADAYNDLEYQSHDRI